MAMSRRERDIRSQLARVLPSGNTARTRHLRAALVKEINRAQKPEPIKSTATTRSNVTIPLGGGVSIGNRPGPATFPGVGGGGSMPFNPFPGTGGGPSGGGGGGSLCGQLPVELRGLCERGINTIVDRVTGGGSSGGGGGSAAPCPDGTVRIGDTCISPGDLFPGGQPGWFPAGGGAVAGSFGMPAIQPSQQTQIRLDCPAGMVLGKDNLCYPKAVLGRRSRFRKWRPSPRPVLSAADAKTLRRADRLRDKVKGVARTAGLTTRKR